MCPTRCAHADIDGRPLTHMDWSQREGGGEKGREGREKGEERLGKVLTITPACCIVERSIPLCISWVYFTLVFVEE